MYCVKGFLFIVMVFVIIRGVDIYLFIENFEKVEVLFVVYSV